MYIPNPSALAGSDTKSIWSGFQQVWIQCYFSWTGSYTKVKEPSLPYNLSVAGGNIVVCMPKDIISIWNANSLVQDHRTQIISNNNHYGTNGDFWYCLFKFNLAAIFLLLEMFITRQVDLVCMLLKMPTNHQSHQYWKQTIKHK